MIENDAPLTEDEFNKLARERTIILPADRDEKAIHTYLTLVRGWKNVFTMRAPAQDTQGAHIRVDVFFDGFPERLPNIRP